MPGSLLFSSGPVPGYSVPLCCVTRYCSGVSRASASSVFAYFALPAIEPSCPCRLMLGEIYRRRRALPNEGLLRVVRPPMIRRSIVLECGALRQELARVCCNLDVAGALFPERRKSIEIAVA